MSQLPWIIKLIGIVVLFSSFFYADLITLFNVPEGGRTPLFAVGVAFYIIGAIIHAVRRRNR